LKIYWPTTFNGQHNIIFG